MNASALAAKPIEDLLHLLTTSGHLDLHFRIDHPVSAAPPELTVDLSGPDTPLLIANNGELLHAIEHIAAKLLHLEPEQHDRISFDAANFKADRDRDLRACAAAAIDQVRATGRPFAFAPMTSRERRLLHLALQPSGLPTASSGLGPRRFVVLYPEGNVPAEPTPAVTPDRTHHIRNTFRRR